MDADPEFGAADIFVATFRFARAFVVLVFFAATFFFALLPETRPEIRPETLSEPRAGPLDLRGFWLFFWPSFLGLAELFSRLSFFAVDFFAVDFFVVMFDVHP